MSEETQKFTQHYEELKQIAETLRIQREANIDELIPMLEKATNAYKICKNRLAEVKVALEQYMPPSDEAALTTTPK